MRHALVMLSLLALQVNATPGVEIQTNKGTMVFELDTHKTPQTAARFVELANAHWYEGKQFYRVVSGHVIQAGLNDDNHPDMKKYAVPAEFQGQFSHKRGCLGLARDEDPNSGSTEFYVCHQDRPHLDGRYAVFGRLVKGVEVLDAIAASEVKQIWLDNPGGKPVAFHQPLQPITILAVTPVELP